MPEPTSQPSQNPEPSPQAVENILLTQHTHTSDFLNTHASINQKNGLIFWLSAVSYGNNARNLYAAKQIQNLELTQAFDMAIFPELSGQFSSIFNQTGTGFFAWIPTNRIDSRSLALPDTTRVIQIDNFQPTGTFQAAPGALLSGEISDTGNGSLFIKSQEPLHRERPPYYHYKRYPIQDYQLNTESERLYTLERDHRFQRELAFTLKPNQTAHQGFLLGYSVYSEQVQDGQYISQKYVNQTRLITFTAEGTHESTFEATTEPTARIAQGEGWLGFPDAAQAHHWHIYWAQDYQLNPEQTPQSLQLAAPEEGEILDFQISTAGEGIYLIKTPHSLLARAIQNFQPSGNYQLIHHLESPEEQFSSQGLSVDTQGNGLIHWASWQRTSPYPAQTIESKVWMRPVKGFKSW